MNIQDVEDLEAILKSWHDVEGCCKHSTPSIVAEGSCCICDAEDPCENAIEAAFLWSAYPPQCYS